MFNKCFRPTKCQGLRTLQLVRLGGSGRHWGSRQREHGRVKVELVFDVTEICRRRGETIRKR